jgi:hypothetical protein
MSIRPPASRGRTASGLYSSPKSFGRDENTAGAGTTLTGVSAPGRIEKPTLFISHAVTDEPIASIIKAEVDRVFARGVTVFASSIPGAVRPGADWLRSIRENLDAASAVAVLITPVSINRPWIWFEVGASWSRMEIDEDRIYPLCVPEINLGELPEPLSRLQALSLGKADHVKQFFDALVEQYGFGNMKGFKGSTIKSKLPRYPTLTVAESDLQSGAIYNGPYEGYSDDELMEVLDQDFVMREQRNNYSSTRYGENLFKSELIHYREVDERLQRPPGTAKRLLDEVVERYDAYPAEGQKFQNSVRFSYADDQV